MISEHVRKLRELASGINSKTRRFQHWSSKRWILEAADTIEALSAKLADMERSHKFLDNGWIYCDEWLPSTAEYMELEPKPYMKRLEIAYMTDTVNYLIGYYDGSKWMDKHHNIIENVVAWKPFLKLPEKRHES